MITPIKFFLNQLWHLAMALINRCNLVFIPEELHGSIPQGTRQVYRLYAEEWGEVEGIIRVEHTDFNDTVHFYRVIKWVIHPEYHVTTIGSLLIPTGQQVVLVNGLTRPIDPRPRRKPVPVAPAYPVPELRPYWRPNKQGFVGYVHTPVIRIGTTWRHAPKGKISVFAQYGDHICRKIVDDKAQAAVAVVGCILELVCKTDLISYHWKVQLVATGQYLQSWFFLDLLDSLITEGKSEALWNGPWEKDWKTDIPDVLVVLSNGELTIPYIEKTPHYKVWDLFFLMNQVEEV